ncbi:MAG TPA: PmoA family protein [Tepidisphaeraceae bacterium]|nr:PmoA family protein [Tepidisphaeraceae bacterium]
MTSWFILSAVRALAADVQTASLNVTGLKPESRFVIVQEPMDFTALLQKLGISGAVDTQTIQLIEKLPDGATQPRDVQWTSDVQPRPTARHLLPATTQSVSYAAEHEAHDTPPVKVTGTLTWVIDRPSAAERGYELRFRVPEGGRFIQVPFEPQDLRAFDAGGRATPPAFPTMQIHPLRPMNRAVELFEGNDLVTGYHLGPSSASVADGDYRRPFLYPVIGPDGISLTEFGKPHDPTLSHAHHYSLWIAHSNVDGHDFWSEKGGVIVQNRLDLQEDGPVFARVVQSTKWVFEKTDLLHERREVTLYKSTGDARVIDFDLQFTPAGKEPVTFGKSTFGFMAARVRQSMTVFDGGGEITNSNGDVNESHVHLKHANWIDLAGPIAPGKWGGVSILDNPANPNHPTMFHCRNDGWACASFTGEASFTLVPDKPLHLRYRILLHRGNAADAHVDRFFSGYITPTVSVGE